MRKGKRKFEVYLDETLDAEIIKLLLEEGITKTIKKALTGYMLGRKLYPDAEVTEDEC